MTERPPSELQRRGPSRSAIVNAPRPEPRDAFTGLFASLHALAQRGGTAIGEAYALAARAVLTRVERVEDRRAEQRFAKRERALRSPGGAPLPR